MAFTFRIIFKGLCAFVPDTPFGSAQQPDSIFVLLPDVLDPRTLKKPQKATVTGDLILPPHFPLLIFDEENLVTTPEQPGFFTKQDPEVTSRTGIVPLFNRDISIWVDGREPRPGSLRLIDGPVVDRSNPTEAEKQYLTWLIKVDDVFEEEEKEVVASRFLLPSLQKEEPGIVTRLLLTAGRLRVNRLTSERWQHLALDALIQDRDGGELVATQLALELEAEKMVKLVFRDFGSQEPVNLIFAPSQTEPYGDVEIDLQNLEADSVLNFPVRSKPKPEVDPDFSVYYDLLQDFEGDAPRPVPRRFVPEGEEQIAGDGKPCSPIGVNKGG